MKFAVNWKIDCKAEKAKSETERGYLKNGCNNFHKIRYIKLLTRPSFVRIS